ncbi:MAG TPA: hypothetical protein DGG95_18605 [Cytophagales bacterium]|jgi:chromosome segregation ATPase|nr:hypothetical protein [Cytophagales bacterium]
MIEILIPTILFLIWFIFSEVYFVRFKKHQTDFNLNQKSFWNNSYFFESIPPVYPTLGIFCTALGITIGIWDFNTDDIQNSIPGLLKGLRLAFIATMAGIVGLIYSQKKSAVIQKQIDDSPQRPKKQSDELSAISGLTNEIQGLKKDNEIQVEKLIKSIGIDLENKVSVKLSSLEKEFSEQLKNLREEQKATSEKANKNTDEIIKAMSENNRLTAKKFDEFSELLKQNNTEALVEVMKRTTEKFNAQMRELINRLVKENFNELNNSVKNLNEWQNQNKEQIQNLTEQFLKTTETFKISANILKEVAENTKSLTADDSKLSQIVQELRKVMIDDIKFQEITNKLTATIETLGKTTESFDETTSKLNDWVRNEKNFKEAAQILISKLEEFRDLNGDVWNKYRQEMSKAVSIVRETSERLGKDLDNINAEFYERLNSTLQNLDQCIQRLVPTNNRR